MTAEPEDTGSEDKGKDRATDGDRFPGMSDEELAAMLQEWEVECYERGINPADESWLDGAQLEPVNPDDFDWSAYMAKEQDTGCIEQNPQLEPVDQDDFDWNAYMVEASWTEQNPESGAEGAVEKEDGHYPEVKHQVQEGREYQEQEEQGQEQDQPDQENKEDNNRTFSMDDLDWDIIEAFSVLEGKTDEEIQANATVDPTSLMLRAIEMIHQKRDAERPRFLHPSQQLSLSTPLSSRSALNSWPTTPSGSEGYSTSLYTSADSSVGPSTPRDRHVNVSEGAHIDSNEKFRSTEGVTAQWGPSTPNKHA